MRYWRNSAVDRLLLVALLVVVSGQAVPNDSVARVGAGGLLLVKTDDIRMVSEALTISQQQINVKYKFLNEAATAIDTVVAFPMPPFGWNPHQLAQQENMKPMDSFVVEVDGHPIKTKVERKALLGKLDITDKLRSAGLSDTQIFQTFADADLDHGGVPGALAKRLMAPGVLDDNFPAWKVSEVAYWDLSFPSRREIVVTHSYTPFTGEIYSVMESRHSKTGTMANIPVSSVRNDNVDRACLDDGSRAAINRRIASLLKQGKSEIQVNLGDVEYILGTAKNWKGPIADFSLDIVKTSADQIVSLCFPGKPTRINDTTLRFKHSNFVPPERIIVNFYSITSNP